MNRMRIQLTQPDWLKKVHEQDEKIEAARGFGSRTVAPESKARRRFLPSDLSQVGDRSISRRVCRHPDGERWAEMAKQIESVLACSGGITERVADKCAHIVKYLLERPEAVSEIPQAYIQEVLNAITYIVKFKNEGKDVASALIEHIIGLKGGVRIKVFCKAFDLMGVLATHLPKDDVSALSKSRATSEQMLDLLVKPYLSKMKESTSWQTYCIGDIRYVLMALQKLYTCKVPFISGNQNAKAVLDFFIDVLLEKSPSFGKKSWVMVDLLTALLNLERFIYDDFNKDFSSLVIKYTDRLLILSEKECILSSVSLSTVISLITARSKMNHLHSSVFHRLLDILIDRVNEDFEKISISKIKRMSMFLEYSRSLKATKFYFRVVDKLLSQKDQKLEAEVCFHLLQCIFMQDNFSRFKELIVKLLNKLISGHSFEGLTVQHQYKLYWFFMVTQQKSRALSGIFDAKIDAKAMADLVKKLKEYTSDRSVSAEYFLHRVVGLRTSPVKITAANNLGERDDISRRVFMDRLKKEFSGEKVSFGMLMDAHPVDAIFEDEKVVVLYEEKKRFIVYDEDDKSSKGYRRSLLAEASNEAIRKMGYKLILAPIYLVSREGGVARFAEEVRLTLASIRSRKRHAPARAHREGKRTIDEPHRKRKAIGERVSPKKPCYDADVSKHSDRHLCRGHKSKNFAKK